MPSRCIACTFGMYWMRFHDRSSVRTKTTFGRSGARDFAGGSSGATAETTSRAATSVAIASRTAAQGSPPQLGNDPFVLACMRRIRTTSALVAVAASTALFAGVALADVFNGTDHRDRING